MPPKRPVEVIELSDSEDEAPTPASAPPTRSKQPSRARVGAVPPDGEEDEALALAIQLSLQEAARARGAIPNGDSAPPKAPRGKMSERAVLERERLERQRAREAVPGGSGLQTVKVASTSSTTVKRPRIATFADLLAPDNDGASASSAASTSRSNGSTTSSTSKTSDRFWQGAVKRVKNAYVPDTDSYSFADLIGPASSLQAAVVSAYCLEPEWVVSHFDAETPILLVMPRQKGDNAPALAQCDLKANTFRSIPKMRDVGPYPGVMHTKLMIYYHISFCRIVIPTANAMSYDWDLIDNAFFVMDFPYSPTDEKDPFKNPTHTQFSKSFFQVCYLLDVPKRFVGPAANYDFSTARDVRLVHSTQGKYHPSKEWNKGGGLASLASAVQSFGFAPGGKWEIEATGSSIGRYSPAWLSQMLGACAGIHPKSYFRSGKNNNVPREYPTPPAGQPVRLPIKIIFPTETEITGSFGSAPGGGTLFCPVKTWDLPSFPQHLFHKGQSKRARVAAHTKIILALHKFPANAPVPAKHEGWMYLGSHNFTSAAWGKLENGSNGPTLAITNYELGVMLPIRADSAEELEKKASEMVTYRRPLCRYSPGERPWQQERFFD
ncbi:hypothetical protein JCM10450v2_001118 [Rhodotorula kratochvilovae]